MKFSKEQRQRVTEQLRTDWLLNEQPLAELAGRHGVGERTATVWLHSIGLYPCTCPCLARRAPTEDDVRLVLDALPVDTGRMSTAARVRLARKLLRLHRFGASHAVIAAAKGRTAPWAYQLVRYGKAIDMLDQLRSGELSQMLGPYGGKGLATAVDTAAKVIRAWFDEHAPDDKPETGTEVEG